MIFIRLLSVNKTNCDDLRREFSYEILNWHYLCAFLTSGNSIRLWRNFVPSRIFAGFGKNAGFLPEPELDSGATLDRTHRRNTIVLRLEFLLHDCPYAVDVNITVVCYVKMGEDNDSCVMKYIEIVPLDNFELSPDSTDVKFDPSTVKVCVFFCLFLVILHS